ncbi:type II secretion system protein [Ideonella dechloratans]|uniref:Type II secretion system protein n=1 Tax=Ideonella dechloratans TaxID=36863 RepID=A0A643F6S0_IDEDE|nr:type II secretion system protein [Ideonella dechloratans]KAB0574155.1 type II secretion system protein [Ideonella dechloratans]
MGCKARQAGFTYLLLLIMLAIVGIASAASVTLGAAMSRQDAQRETRAIEEDFKQALESYRFNTPVGQPVMGPNRLEDLLADTRGGRLLRHLRRIPADPLTGKTDWIAVMGTDGGIEAVKSRSGSNVDAVPGEVRHADASSRKLQSRGQT